MLNLDTSTGIAFINDIIIFGTGDRLGITTMTADAKAIRAISGQGFDFSVFCHLPCRLTGK